MRLLRLGALERVANAAHQEACGFTFNQIILRTAVHRLQGQRFLEFERLFDEGSSLPVVVITFIALLELARENLLEITQGAAFPPIYVRLAYAST